jgi:DNA polymerase IIIc chi subunit
MTSAVITALIVQAVVNGLAVSIACFRAKRRSAAEAAYWRKYDTARYIFHSLGAEQFGPSGV